MDEAPVTDFVESFRHKELFVRKLLETSKGVCFRIN